MSSTKKNTSHFTLINSENNIFQRAEVLKRNREKRFRYGEFLVEGVSQLSLAQKNGWEFRSLFIERGRLLSSWAEKLIQDAAPQDIYELSPELMAKLSEKDEHSEILGVIAMRRPTLEEITPRAGKIIAVFDRPASPGNLGSSLRSADAFGVTTVIITGHAVDLYDPHVVRGSMGALFGMQIAAASSHTDILTWMEQAKKQGIEYTLVGSSGKGGVSLTEYAFSENSILVFGNETVGMSRGYMEGCDEIVRIPIGGTLSSLNVSCAASIVLYEMRRQHPVSS